MLDQENQIASTTWRNPKAELTPNTHASAATCSLPTSASDANRSAVSDTVAVGSACGSTASRNPSKALFGPLWKVPSTLVALLSAEEWTLNVCFSSRLDLLRSASCSSSC